MSEIINAFPGYEFKEVPGYSGKQNVYRGTVLGFGGYIVGEPGIYHDVALLDISGMHPASIIAMNYFGKYTETYKNLRQARVYVKHHDYDSARKMFNGKLAKYLDDPSSADQLSKALKLPQNQAYGLTSASFDNPMRDKRNVNNIVALRGALFMRTLQDEVEDRGFHIVAIRTDSIKIPGATKEIIEFCMDFAKKYGYEFEHEATYDRMCLVNKSAYIAKYSDDESINGKHAGKWTATATQFQVPYVFKTLFSKEPVVFEDKCETKTVQKGALYLDMNEGMVDVSEAEKELEFRKKIGIEDLIGYKNPTFKEVSDDQLRDFISSGHNYIFVGRVGQFCPIKPGCGGGVLLRKQGDKYHAATGSKGYRWMESEMVRNLGKEEDIDLKYYNTLVDKAVESIEVYGDFEAFVS